MKKVPLFILALILIGSAVYWFVIWDSSTTKTTKKEAKKTLTTADVIKATFVTYTDDGFDPSEYIGSAGGDLTVTNNSSSDLDFASDDHPTHTKNSELNIGTIEAGQSMTIDLTEKGEWGFHNHDNSSHTGSITVE